MRNRLRLIPVLLIACLVPGLAAAASTSVNVPAKLKSVLPKTRSKSGIAVRLPSTLDAGVSASRVHGAIEDVSSGSYHLSLGVGRGCHESTACFVAAFFGTRGGSLDATRKVSLARGISGRFRPISCGASCGPAEVQWKQGNVAYSIQFKGSKAQMVGLANSAIRGGAR